MTSDTSRVFVSHHHSRDEDAFTSRLVNALKAAGADVWVDISGITSARLCTILLSSKPHEPAERVWNEVITPHQCPREMWGKGNCPIDAVAPGPRHR